MACTCSGSHRCGFCAAYEVWDSRLTDAERGEYALAFIDSLTSAHGVLRGEPVSRAPWIGHRATVEFNGVREFEHFLEGQFAQLWRAAA
jgi:hypothetical protein